MSAFLRKYATLTHIYVPLIKRGVVDYAVGADWTPAAGDVKVSIDGAAAANIGTLPTAITMGNGAFWDFTIATGEVTGKKIVVTISDSATKAVEDQCFLIETYGHASAEYQADLSAANLPAAVNSIAANAITATSIASNAITAAKIATDAITAAKIATDAITEIQAGLSTLTQAQVTGGAYALNSASFAFNAALDFTTTQKAATLARVTLTDAATNTGTLAGAATVVLTDASLTFAKFGAGAITSTVLANDAITDAKVASDVTIASVTGAVGSVTGAVGSVTGSIGGNVTGSVGSVVGAVGSVTGNVDGNVSGSVASVVGNIGGNLNGNVEGSVSGSVSGSVGSVTGAVGSVTGSVGSVVGNVGGNVVGSTASVAGAVGSVTGNVGGDVQGKVLGGGSGTISGDGVRASSVTGAVGSVTGAVGSVTGSVGTVANPANIADAVWDEAQADHITSGTFGEIATEIAALPNAAANAAALLDLSNGIETSITPRQALRLILAAAAGKLSGAATTTVVIRNVGDTKDRITATVSSEGNRTAVSVDAT